MATFPPGSPNTRVTTPLALLGTMEPPGEREIIASTQKNRSLSLRNLLAKNSYDQLEKCQ